MRLSPPREAMPTAAVGRSVASVREHSFFFGAKGGRAGERRGETSAFVSAAVRDNIVYQQPC